MASALSTYLGNSLLRWIGGNAMPTAPAACYLALFDGDPKASGTEVTTTIDAAGRQAITWSVPSAGVTNTMSNSAVVDFGNAAGAVANLSHMAIMDASTGGNILASAALNGGPYSVASGTPVNFPSSNISLQVGS